MCPPDPDPPLHNQKNLHPSESPHTTLFLPSRRISSWNSSTSSLGFLELVTVNLTRTNAAALASELRRLLEGFSSWKVMELNFKENK